MNSYIFVTSEDQDYWFYTLSGNAPSDITNAPCSDARYRKSLAKSVYRLSIPNSITSLRDCQTGGYTNGKICQIIQGLSSSLVSVIVPLLFIMTLLISGCGKNKELMYRYSYKKAIYNYKGMDTLVDANVSFQPVPGLPKTELTAMKLDPKVQRELLRTLSRKVKTGDSLFNYLATPFKEAKGDHVYLTEKHTFSRRAIISVSDLGISDADRISKITIKIIAPVSLIRFTNCDKITTQYQTINLGTYSFQNSTYGEVDANAGYGDSVGTSLNTAKRNTNGDSTTNNATFSGGLGASVSGKYGFNNQLNGTQTYQKRLVALSASFHDNTVSFYQESTTGINLNGTIVSDLSFEFMTNDVLTYIFYDFDDLFDKKNNVVTPDKISMNASALSVPQLKQDDVFPVDLQYTAVYRKVTNNDKYIPEGYQGVDLLKGSVTKTANAVLIKAKDILPKKWVICDVNSRLKPVLDVGLNGNSGDILFSSYDKAQNFLRWLLRSTNVSLPITADHYQLSLNGNALTNANRVNLMVIPQ